MALRAPDGVPVVGIALGTGSRGVVLGHQSGGDVCDVLAFGRVLAARGYAVLALDFEDHGASGSTYRKGAAQPAVRPYADDLRTGIAYLRSLGVQQVGLLGVSMGGTSAVVAGAGDPDVQAVVDISGPAVFGGLDSVTAAGTRGVPLLLLVGTRDPAVPTADLREVDAASSAPGTRLLVLDSNRHGKDLLAEPAVSSAVLSFLDAQLH